MQCPFPGMDPYLESPAVWQDFHNSFMTYAKELLAGIAPDGYLIRLDEEVRLLGGPPDEPTLARPDFAVLRSALAPAAVGGGAALLEPAVVPLPEPDWEEIRNVALEVRRWPGNELVTVFELLSPWNKEAEGQTDFLRKRQAMRRRGVHWVELDLLLGGRRTPLGQDRPLGDYFALVARKERRPNAEVYAWSLRAPLPTIPLPLRAPDPDLPLDLARVFAMTYERGRFGAALLALPAGPPPVPLPPDDLAWATALAATRSR